MVNSTSNAILKRIHQVLGNLVRNFNIILTYVNEDDPLSGFLYAAAFVICSITNRLEGYITGKILFGCGMILQIKNNVDWELICQRKQMQINKDNIQKNIK